MVDNIGDDTGLYEHSLDRIFGSTDHRPSYTFASSCHVGTPASMVGGIEDTYPNGRVLHRDDRKLMASSKQSYSACAHHWCCNSSSRLCTGDRTVTSETPCIEHPHASGSNFELANAHSRAVWVEEGRRIQSSLGLELHGKSVERHDHKVNPRPVASLIIVHKMYHKYLDTYGRNQREIVGMAPCKVSAPEGRGHDSSDYNCGRRTEPRCRKSGIPIHHAIAQGSECDESCLGVLGSILEGKFPSFLWRSKPQKSAPTCQRPA